MTDNLTRKQLLERIATDTGLFQREVERCLRGLAAVAAEQLAAGAELRLPDLGTLAVKPTSPKRGTAPDGTPWEKPAGKRVAFKAAKPLRDAVART